MITYFAHGGEVEAAEEASLITAVTHQPTWVSLLVIIFVLFGLYALMEKVRVKALNRILVLLPLLILIAIGYLQHNPTVTAVVLSAGFIATFALAFTLMRTPPDDGKSEETQEKP
jgi:hypothetical protein